jgi:hypothetical protein
MPGWITFDGYWRTHCPLNQHRQFDSQSLITEITDHCGAPLKAGRSVSVSDPLVLELYIRGGASGRGACVGGAGSGSREVPSALRAAP